jgi:DNA-3-methyladenine glycosylase
MWGPPGYLYTYFNYGMHWLMNFVTEAQGFPAAALLRAMVADEGSDLMRARRGNVPAGRLLDGPAKICQAFALDGAWSGYDLCQEQASLYLAPGLEVPDCGVTLGPRVGLNKVPEPWKSIPWRFSIQATDIQVSLEEI